MDRLEILCWRAMLPVVTKLCGHFSPITTATVRAADGQDDAPRLFWSEFMRLSPDTAEAIEREFKNRTNAVIDAAGIPRIG